MIGTSTVILSVLATVVYPTQLPQPKNKAEIYAIVRGSDNKLFTDPIRIEIEKVRSVNLSPAEIDQRWQLVANRPDHPDRFEIETLRELAVKPERQQITIVFGKGRWYYRERSSLGTSLECGGDSDRRWMLFRRDLKGGQLTITSAGVPFPAGYNVGQFFDTLVQRVAAVGNWDVLFDTVIMQDSKHSSSANSVPGLLFDGPAGERLHIREKPGGATTVFEYGPVSANSPDAKNARAVIWTSNVRVREENPDTWPFPILADSFQKDEKSGFRETWKVTEISTLSIEELKTFSSVPQTDSSIRIRDYSQPGSSPTDVQTALWTSDGRVKLLSSDQVLSSSVSGFLGNRTWGWWLAASVIALSVAMAIYLRMRNSR